MFSNIKHAHVNFAALFQRRSRFKRNILLKQKFDFFYTQRSLQSSHQVFVVVLYFCY